MYDAACAGAGAYLAQRLFLPSKINPCSLTCMLMIHACLMISNAAWEAAPARTQMADANMIMPTGTDSSTAARQHHQQPRMPWCA
jgi:hypothetical protein